MKKINFTSKKNRTMDDQRILRGNFNKDQQFEKERSKKPSTRKTKNIFQFPQKNQTIFQPPPAALRPSPALPNPLFRSTPHPTAPSPHPLAEKFPSPLGPTKKSGGALKAPPPAIHGVYSPNLQLLKPNTNLIRIREDRQIQLQCRDRRTRQRRCRRNRRVRRRRNRSRNAVFPNFGFRELAAVDQNVEVLDRVAAEIVIRGRMNW